MVTVFFVTFLLAVQRFIQYVNKSTFANILRRFPMRNLIAILATVCTAFTSCAQTSDDYKKITAQEAQTMMDNQAVIILDVRTQDEYDAGHIPNAILLPDFDIATKAEQVLPKKDAVILVHCRSGVRSAGAAKKLASMGYTNIYDFGGIIDWTGEIVK